jgi:hypothetical protein
MEAARLITDEAAAVGGTFGSGTATGLMPLRTVSAAW